MTENGHTAVKPMTGAVPGMSLATVKIIEHLKDGPIGRVVSMAELRELTGKNCSVGGDGYGYLRTACENVTKNYNLFWTRIRGENVVKCLGAEETDVHVEGTLRHIHKTSRRAVRRLGTVNLGSLSEEARPAYVAKLAALGTLTELSASKTQKKLIQKNIAKAVNMQKLLDVWVEGKETD